VAPFGQWIRAIGGREYRGIRTTRYTYVRDLNGPWLLFDNEADPYQMESLAGRPEHAPLQARLDALLLRKLREAGDEFRPAGDYITKWGYRVDATGTVRYTP
jgi:arylsulfatase A-like enzyme